MFSFLFFILDLGIVGTQIQSRKSSSKSMRQQQSSNDILNGLRSEGLLAAFGQKQGGMSFEVMIAPEFGILNKPPARLASLKSKKKKKKTLTKEELEAKMEAAEERRKRKEAKMIAKLNTSAKELQAHKVANTVEKELQVQAEEKMTKTLDKAAANREAHFKALKEKLEQKKKHAEKVRQAKLARLAEDKPAEEEQASAVWSHHRYGDRTLWKYPPCLFQNNFYFIRKLNSGNLVSNMLQIPRRH